MEDLEKEVDIVNLCRKISVALEKYAENLFEKSGVEKEYHSFLNDYINLKSFYQGEFSPTKKEINIAIFQGYIVKFFEVELSNIIPLGGISLNRSARDLVRPRVFNTKDFGFNYFLKNNNFSKNEIEKILDQEDYFYSNNYYKKLLFFIENGEKAEENTEKANNYLFSLMEFLEFAEKLK